MVVKLSEERGLIVSLRQERCAKNLFLHDYALIVNKNLRGHLTNQGENIRQLSIDQRVFEIWI